MSKMGVDPTSVKQLSEKAATEPTRFNATERSAFIKDHILKISKMLQDKHSVDDVKAVFP